MRISEIQGEEALDALCDVMEPAVAIMADPKISEMYKAKLPRVKIVAEAIRRHKKETIAILAAVDRVPVDEYRVNLLTLPIKLLEVMNDPGIEQLFTYQGQTGDAKSSGSASGSTKDN